MVMQSPFQKLLQSATEEASRDPASAFDRFEELFNKSCSEDEVQQVCSFASNLGGAALGRFEDTITFLKQLLTHPAVDYVESETRRSIHRAIAVMHYCLGNDNEAQEHQQFGVQNASEHCRLAIMSANTLVARQRFQEAVPHLKLSAALSSEVAEDDEILKQVAAVGMNISRLVEAQLNICKNVYEQASYASKEAWKRDSDWQVQHKALYQYAKALLQCGKPTQTLDVVQQMMRLEREHKAGPMEQFFSAALASRAQTARGQTKIASQALAACEQMIQQIPEAQRDQAQKVLEAAQTELQAEQDRKARQ